MERLRAADPPPHPSAFVLSRPAVRLALPHELTAALGYDAVGTPRQHGERIMASLPRAGCVFADDLRWWWIVPAGSDIGVTWPTTTSYAIGAYLGPAVPETYAGRADLSWSGPRPDRPVLIHHPAGDSPYTPPIPLYFLVCRLAGSAPHWSPDPGA
ncbi:hypothetical protein [Streptomyces chiangmaiensis]|uniref:Uncharacterized protein n=1 Tax=Streptomyces chiangmaiensis TaxID=766497 RepID=A0ABU7FBT7_9ACTN|nr:hypothetical protein [Streptomyces chiangmaiensis]MED7821017.1 hypothetical protein [Streptomyces chiangmaiensis]